MVNHPLGAQFRNAGWVHLAAFRTLMPDAVARGSHVFRAQSDAVDLTFPDPSQEEEPIDWPPTDDEDRGAQDKRTQDSGDESGKEDEKENDVRLLSTLSAPCSYH